jgi:hypothetical protein
LQEQKQWGMGAVQGNTWQPYPTVIPSLWSRSVLHLDLEYKYARKAYQKEAS